MKKGIFSLFFILISIVIFGQLPIDNVAFYNVKDVKWSEIFENENFKKHYNKRYDNKDFRDNYFYAWKQNKDSFAENFKKSPAFKVHFYFKQNPQSPCIQGNYNALTDNWAEDLNKNINPNAFPNIAEYGIILNETNVREVPTDEFCFKRVRSAGEGYPFDYFQYTTLWMGTPVLILHQSEDEMWYFVASPYSTGWIKSSDIGQVSNPQKKKIESGLLMAITKENTLLKTSYGTKKAQIGTLLPLFKNNTVCIPRRTKNGKTAFDKVELAADDMELMPLEFNESNIRKLLDGLMGNKYSWGGLGGGRDCSATLKDFLTPFGIWLPRNSSQQKNVGKVIPLSGTRDDKGKSIAENGIPFLTVIYKRGHSMLYVGTNQKGVPLIFHNAWGLKVIIEDKKLAEIANAKEKYGLFGISDSDENKVKSRYIIGKAAITTVEPEAGFPKSEKITFDYFIENIISMNLLTH